MLILTRRCGEQIVINGNIIITVVAAKRRSVRLGISAPETVSVDRSEIHARRSEFAAGPAAARGSRPGPQTTPQ